MYEYNVLHVRLQFAESITAYLKFCTLSSEIDECWSSPCQNGGLCTDLLNAFQCDCAVGYVGTVCDISKTDQNRDFTLHVLFFLAPYKLKLGRKYGIYMFSFSLHTAVLFL